MYEFLLCQWDKPPSAVVFHEPEGTDWWWRRGLGFGHSRSGDGVEERAMNQTINMCQVPQLSYRIGEQ
jgi:hypothetical protein